MIILPWPDKKLNPNARIYWAQKAKAVKAAREAAGWATLAAKIKIEGEGAITLKITFHPPDKRKRDLDNMMASLKGVLDGVADGLGVNDNRFRFELEIGGVVKGGRVMIEVVGKRNVYLRRIIFS